ncbi:MAG: PAS domain-containing protein, partial [Adhaeribacter sp.]
MAEIELSSSFFLSILQNSTDLISIIDATGNYKFVGGSVKTILGYTPEEMIGTSAFGYIHELDQARTGLALQQAVTNKFSSLPVFRFRNKAGEWRWIDCSITNLADNPEVMGFVTNSRDVTDRVEEEERKKESQAHYEALFYNHPDAVFELNQQGHFSKINQMVSKILEYENDQILDHHFQKFVHPDFMPAATEAFVQTMAGETHYNEISVVRKSGTTAILGITVLPVIIHNQVVSLLGIAKDITREKLQQERLEKLSLIARKTATCMLVMNRQWEIEWVNEAFEKVLGYSLPECLGRHPAQLLFAGNSREHEKIRKKVGKTGIYRGEVMNYTKSGAEIWFNLEVSPVADQDGQVIQYIAIRTDITDRKMKEAELLVVTQDLFKQN